MEFFRIFCRLYAEKWLKIDHFRGKIIARILRKLSLHCEFGPSKCEAKAKRTLFFFLRSEAKRIRNFAFAFAIMRNSHCECTPLFELTQVVDKDTPWKFKNGAPFKNMASDDVQITLTGTFCY